MVDYVKIALKHRHRTHDRTINNLEFLALAIFSSPGQSGRFYLRILHQYVYYDEYYSDDADDYAHARNNTGNFCAEYFAPSGKYINKLWFDIALPTIPFDSFLNSARPRGESGQFLRPAKSSWWLTVRGLQYVGTGLTKLNISS